MGGRGTPSGNNTGNGNNTRTRSVKGGSGPGKMPDQLEYKTAKQLGKMPRSALEKLATQAAVRSIMETANKWEKTPITEAEAKKRFEALGGLGTKSTSGLIKTIKGQMKKK